MAKTVVVIEESDAPSAARRALEESADLDVYVACDSAAAIDILARMPVDCVLLHVPPDFDDQLEVFAAPLTPFPTDPVRGAALVVLSEAAHDEGASAAIARGADDYLVATKTSPDAVVLAVRHAIERRIYQRMLRQRDTRFAAAVDALQEGVAIHDRAGRLLHSNPAAAQLLGYGPRSVDQIAGAPPLPMVRADGTPVPADEHPARQVFLSGHAIRGATYGIVQRDGATRWLSVNAFSVPATDPESDVCIVTTFADVTEQRRALEALEHMTLRDPLTKLPNRALLCDRIEQALGRARGPHRRPRHCRHRRL